MRTLKMPPYKIVKFDVDDRSATIRFNDERDLLGFLQDYAVQIGTLDRRAPQPNGEEKP